MSRKTTRARSWLASISPCRCSRFSWRVSSEASAVNACSIRSRSARVFDSRRLRRWQVGQFRKRAPHRSLQVLLDVCEAFTDGLAYLAPLHAQQPQAQVVEQQAVDRANLVASAADAEGNEV